MLIYISLFITSNPTLKIKSLEILLQYFIIVTYILGICFKILNERSLLNIVLLLANCI